MPRIQSTIHQNTRSRSIISEHEVLRNTYFLLGISLLICAVSAFFSMITNIYMGPLVTIIGAYGLLFLVQMNATSAYGILFTFLFTGFMGFSLGPILNSVVHGYSNGSQILLTTTACTGSIFLALSAYVLTTKKDFSYLGGFLFILLFTGVVMSFLNIFLGYAVFELFICSLMILTFSGLIMFHTSQIVHGGERNYILATVSLFLAIYNLFVYLLRLFTILNGRRD